MQLESETAAEPGKPAELLPDIHTFDSRLSLLSEELKRIIREKEEAEENCHTAAFYGKQSLEKGMSELDSKAEEEREQRAVESAQREQYIRRSCREWESRVEDIYRSLRSALRDRERRSIEELEQELDLKKGGISKELEIKINENLEKPTRYTQRVEELEAQADALLESLTQFAARYNVDLEDPGEPHAAAFLEKIQDINTAISEFETMAEDTGRAMKLLKRRCWPALKWGKIVMFSFFIILHVSALVIVFRNGGIINDYIKILGVFAVSMILGLIYSLTARSRVIKVVNWLQMNIINARHPLARLEQLQRERAANDATLKERIDRVHAAEDEMNREAAEIKTALRQELDDLNNRYERVKKKMEGRLDRNLERLAKWKSEAEIRAEKDTEEAKKQLKHDIENRKENADDQKQRQTAELKSEWDDTINAFYSYAAESFSLIRDQYPEWGDSPAENWHEPACYPGLVPVGTGRVNLMTLAGLYEQEPPFPFPGEAEVDFPVALSFPGTGSMFVKSGSKEREQAMKFLENMVLRIFTSFPPSKSKITFIDPVGLGQSFSAFMRLADFDETLVNSKIWTDSSHIEQRLTDLTEHMEKVIQKYLRNQYETVEEYNREAGMMAEPYRFLVIADFPTGFSDLALERLAAIISSGPRCGVYTIIQQDAKQKLSEKVDMGDIRRAGPVFTSKDGGFSIDSKGMYAVEFTEDTPPDTPGITGLLESVGEKAEEAGKVELPFTAATPGKGKLWSLNTDEDIRIPIGQAGVDRLQYLSLGKGTRQHALIGGRTGSGKSTLFHVLITNAALWYGPDEVEFYLIDFKKGVEFKRLASYKLPHARAIGIESDREFGVSVLRRIDEELTRRGELFRKAGVQNLAGYRKTDSPETFPRTLLIIDEFQELFTEDDSAARDAALYLDRFVRQGRAFGIHVILGSQTLSGIYSLAKSTLGQMGVRIALQCNESDSHLILGEDNTAARLLARPGEAIYNDMSGLLEGNHPFQVVWLPEEVQEDHLKMIAQKAETDEYVPPTPPVIFEGNAPADLENNRELFTLMEEPFKEEHKKERAWVGEASAIKGPTEIEFFKNAGSNLLIVGQHREAAFAVFSSTVISLAARHEPGKLDIAVLTPGGTEGLKDQFEKLAEAVPHSFEIVHPGGFDELFSRVETRWAEGTDQEQLNPMYIFVFGIHRLRTLRQDDDYLFATDSDAGPEPGERFADILGEGPETGLHSIIWCDGLTNLNRTFARKTMREFDMKILFQMSASDSSELIDNTVANTLGLHGALLAVESDGTLEKFRPYSMPGPGMIEDINSMLESKYTGKKRKKK